MQNLTKKTELQ